MRFESVNISEYERRYRARRVQYRILSVLACITVFFTTYALILPAITMEAETICGIESHSHDEECYDAAGNLICTLEEHEHDMPCFAAPKVIQPDYICGCLYEHTHKDECYSAGGELICTLVEHMHTDECLSAPGTVESEGNDDCDELVEETAPAELVSVTAPLAATNEDFYSSDLSEFLTDVELTDVDGNVIDLNDREAVLNAGERYRLFLHFDENPDTNHLKQFVYNSDGYLVYDLDAIGLVFDNERSIGGDITILNEGNPKVVGHYMFQLDAGTGNHLAMVWFDDVDVKGNPTPGSNFIDMVQDAGFGHYILQDEDRSARQGGYSRASGST